MSDLACSEAEREFAAHERLRRIGAFDLRMHVGDEDGSVRPSARLGLQVGMAGLAICLYSS